MARKRASSGREANPNEIGNDFSELLVWHMNHGTGMKGSNTSSKKKLIWRIGPLIDALHRWRPETEYLLSNGAVVEWRNGRSLPDHWIEELMLTFFGDAKIPNKQRDVFRRDFASERSRRDAPVQAPDRTAAGNYFPTQSPVAKRTRNQNPVSRVVAANVANLNLASADDPERTRSLNRVRAQIESKLAASQSALQAMIDANPTPDIPQGPAAAATLIERLVETDWRTVIRWLRSAYDDIEAERESAIDPEALSMAGTLADASATLAAIAQILIPHLYDANVIQQIVGSRRDGNASVWLVECHIETVGEIIMASVDRRATAFRHRVASKEYPRGRYQLPLPPESGIDDENDTVVQVQRMLNGLFSHDEWSRLRDLIDDFLEREFVHSATLLAGRNVNPGRDENSANGDRARRVKTIAQELVNATSSRKTYYLIYKVPSDENAARVLKDGFDRMKTEYRAIEILAFSGDDDVKNLEQEFFGPFVWMLPVASAQSKQWGRGDTGA